VVFKRRNKRSWLRIVFETVWPRGGWGRGARYIQHRLRRIPDSPQRIGRGIFAGVFISFTPLYGLHFLVSATLAWLIRGNVVASLLATFFGNPITFPIIAALSLRLGNLILYGEFTAAGQGRLGEKFSAAFEDLWQNTLALFTPETAEWDGLVAFYWDVFLPFTVGGMVPGLITATVIYRLSLPVIVAYQNRRRGRLKARLAGLGKGGAPGGGEKGVRADGAG
jgi:uncharacterized protein (DUF2062 family)